MKGLILDIGFSTIRTTPISNLFRRISPKPAGTVPPFVGEPRVTMIRMKWKRFEILAIACLLSVCAFAQAKPDVAINTTVCDIVKAPQDFYGKRVQLRARLWSDGKSFWVNETGALPIGKVCSWLPTDFFPSTNLIGSTALGTFTGTGRLRAYSPDVGFAVLRAARS